MRGAFATTDDDAVADRLRLFRNHGMRVVPPRGAGHQLQAHGPRCGDRSRAAGAPRRAHGTAPPHAAAQLGGDYLVPSVPEGRDHVWHQFVMRFPGERQAVIDGLTERGIGTLITVRSRSTSRPTCRTTCRAQRHSTSRSRTASPTRCSRSLSIRCSRTRISRPSCGPSSRGDAGGPVTGTVGGDSFASALSAWLHGPQPRAGRGRAPRHAPGRRRRHGHRRRRGRHRPDRCRASPTRWR